MIRGICICAVVLIHCKCATIESARWEIIWSLVFRQVINFPVGVFLFLSGYFTSRRIEKIGGGYGRNRLLRIGVPYVLWSLLYYFIYNRNGNLSIISFIKSLMMGVCAGHLYYLLILLELIIITPLLFKALKSKQHRYIPFTLTIVYLVVLEGYQYITGDFVGGRHRIFVAWLIYYYLGIYVREKGLSKVINLKKCMWCTFLALVLSIAEGVYVFYSFQSISDAITQVKLSSCLYTLSVIGIVLNLENKIKMRKNNIFVLLGNESYGIYLCHILVLSVITEILSLFRMEVALPLYQAVQWIFTICGSYLVLKVWRRIKRINSLEN